MSPVTLRRGHTAGFTLVELLAALVIVSILASLAAPRFDQMVFRARARGALNQFTADLAYARMLAVREGHRTVLRFTRTAGTERCHLPTYQLVVKATPERLVKQTRLELDSATCLDLGSVDSLAFNSRGLPATLNNRKVRVVRGASADSLSISILGRVYRWH